MRSPLSLTCDSVAGSPVSVTCSISPALRVTTASSALTLSVPWVITTLPLKCASPSSVSTASARSAPMSMGWLRSVDLASAGPARTRASAGTSRRRESAAARRIASLDIGEQFHPVGVEVGPEALAAQYRVAPGDGHQRGAARLVLFRQDFQSRRLQAHAF